MAISIKKETLKNGKTSYKFVVNLGVPEGEVKSRIVTRRRFATSKEAQQKLKKLQAQTALGIFPEKKTNSTGSKSLKERAATNEISSPTQSMTFQEVLL